MQQDLMAMTGLDNIEDAVKALITIDEDAIAELDPMRISGRHINFEADLQMLVRLKSQK